MIDLEKEKSYALSAKDRYDILSFATEAADDGGFLNSFVFERAIYSFAAIILEEDKAQKADIQSRVAANLIEAWDHLVQNNIIQEMQEKYAEELEQLAQEGWAWFEEYENFATSARGILNLVEQFSGDIVQSAANRLNDTMQESGASTIIDIADKWGLNNAAMAPAREQKDYEEKDVESLFE